jgi:hypothetical protein
MLTLFLMFSGMRIFSLKLSVKFYAWRVSVSLLKAQWLYKILKGCGTVALPISTVWISCIVAKWFTMWLPTCL